MDRACSTDSKHHDFPSARHWVSLVGGLLAACMPGPASARVEIVDAQRISEAVRASLPLLQSSADQWFERRACVSCHHHTLGMMAVSLAEQRGFVIDRGLFNAQVDEAVPRSAASIEDVLQGDAGINGQLGQGYKLLALAVGKVGASVATDARALFLLDMQGPDGRWRSGSHRPPLEDCDTTATALSSRAIQLYAPPGNEARLVRAVESARDWLQHATPASNEEHTMRLFGLAWTAADRQHIQAAVEELAAAQRPDGGWAQLETRGSDAYATGQALVALHEAGGLSVFSSCYQRGVAYLLKEQLADGTWSLETRRRGDGLPYFETGFPHGENQFIAYAASAWATMALTLAAHPGPSAIFLSIAKEPRAAPDPELVDPLPPLVRAAAYGSIAELRALLDAGADVNRAGERGLTALMADVRDPEKVTLLLDHGARPELGSEQGFTALILAAGTNGGADAAELLLRRGADVHARAEDGSTALWRAAAAGNGALLERLLAAGAQVDAPALMDLPALHVAVWQGDAAMVKSLLGHGADPDGSIQADIENGPGTPLISAAIDGFPEVVALLLDAGARVEATDELGRTALAWAAVVDCGNDRTMSALLGHGASKDARDLEGKSVLDHAHATGKPSALAMLASSR